MLARRNFFNRSSVGLRETILAAPKAMKAASKVGVLSVKCNRSLKETVHVRKGTLSIKCAFPNMTAVASSMGCYHDV